MRIYVDSSNTVHTVIYNGGAGGIEVDTVPDDFVGGKYIYENGTYTVNPNYTAPTETAQPTIEERVAAMEEAVQEMILMQLGGE